MPVSKDDQKLHIGMDVGKSGNNKTTLIIQIGQKTYHFIKEKTNTILQLIHARKETLQEKSSLSSECCGAGVSQKVFLNKNGNMKPITHQEFERLRQSEHEAKNFLWVPGVVFRWVCESCGNITNPYRIFDRQKENKEE